MNDPQYDLQCVHGSLGTFFESTCKAVRKAGPIAEASDKLYHELLDKFFSADSFVDLPEVIAFRKMQAKASGIAADLLRLGQEQQQAEQNIQRAITSTLTGEKLANAIADAKRLHQIAAQRVETLKAGIQTFHEALARDGSKTRDAMKERLRESILPKIQAAAETSRQRLFGELRSILDHREKFLDNYHKRSNIESTISGIKRLFGEHVRSRTDTASKNEVLCKILCYNLTCLIHSQCEMGIATDFWGDKELPGKESS